MFVYLIKSAISSDTIRRIIEKDVDVKLWGDGKWIFGLYSQVSGLFLIELRKLQLNCCFEIARNQEKFPAHELHMDRMHHIHLNDLIHETLLIQEQNGISRVYQ
ncbi:MAG: hypothetical protein HQ568_05035 [Calditrichaeota bacterium]|nr:hypothetical protein [Calditrichota bacterium]